MFSDLQHACCIPIPKVIMKHFRRNSRNHLRSSGAAQASVPMVVTWVKCSLVMNLASPTSATYSHRRTTSVLLRCDTLQTLAFQQACELIVGKPG